MDNEAAKQLVEQFAEQTRRHFDAVAAGLRSELSETRQELRGEIAASRRHAESVEAETRRHIDVVAEGLRKDLQLVAEGVATLNEKVERGRSETAKELAEVKSMIRFSYAELDRRLRTLEDTVLHLEERLTRLEAGRSN